MKRLSRRNDPALRPVQHLEVDEKPKKWKWVLIILLLVVGVALIVTSVTKFLSVSPGWETIQANVNAGESCADDFVLLYLLGESDQAPNLERQALVTLYTEAATEAHQIFHGEKTFSDVRNVAYLNAHVNETVEVPKALYEAFSLMEKHGNRSLFLAPLYREYLGLFLSDNDATAAAYDPDKSEEQAEYFAQVLSYVSDENAVKLELLGGNQVRLCVSDAYLQFAQEQSISAFMDFSWMKNAFIADFLAQRLTDAGYTNGTLSSFDGYSRNLDSSGRTYRMNIFDRVGQDIYLAGSLEYSDVSAFVALRNYPSSTLAVQQYYGWADGSFTSCHIDPKDGRNRTACNDLLGYSKTSSCAEILLKLFPVYIADSLELSSLADSGIETVYCADYRICASDPTLNLASLYDKDGIRYEKG